jgi:hypothetical protein
MLQVLLQEFAAGACSRRKDVHTACASIKAQDNPHEEIVVDCQDTMGAFKTRACKQDRLFAGPYGVQAVC